MVLSCTGGSSQGFLASDMPDNNKKFIVVVSLCITGRARRGELISKKKELSGIVLRRF
jgi:hypothetical protein